jgi:hypothetical protein
MSVEAVLGNAGIRATPVGAGLSDEVCGTATIRRGGEKFAKQLIARNSTLGVPSPPSRFVRIATHRGGDVTQRSHRLIGFGVLFGALVGTSAGAQSDPAAKPNPNAANPAAKGDVKSDKVAAKEEKRVMPPGQRGPDGTPGQRGDGLPGKAGDGMPGKPGHGMKGGDLPGHHDDKSNQLGKPMNEPRGMPAPHGRRSAMRALREGIKDGSIKKDELKARLQQLRESEQQRRKEHQQMVKQRWGKALALEPAKQELRLHAKRSAMLDRALVVAQTEAKPTDQAKLAQRIEMLIDKENARHERTMMRLSSMGTDPSGANAKTDSPTTAKSNQQGAQ